MTDTTSIPLNKLTSWDGNVRKTAGADTALAELAASIAAHGLLQSLLDRHQERAMPPRAALRDSLGHAVTIPGAGVHTSIS